jgi:hypothetical protein
MKGSAWLVTKSWRVWTTSPKMTIRGYAITFSRQRGKNHNKNSALKSSIDFFHNDIVIAIQIIRHVVMKRDPSRD